jgi:hypothetical protein
MKDDFEDILHLGAVPVAVRVFGNADKKNVRRVYRLTELPDDKRPEWLERIGHSPAAWERKIRRASQ